MIKSYYITSESISPGHPDVCSDVVADSIIDRFMENDPESRVAVEVLLSGNNIYIGGETRSKYDFTLDETKEVVDNAFRNIGYKEDYKFTPSQAIRAGNVNVTSHLLTQSNDIAMGVDTGGAGDQGIMFGYAENSNDNYMPPALEIAKRINNSIYKLAKDDSSVYGIDIKTQVTLKYNDNNNFDVDTVVVSVPTIDSVAGNFDKVVQDIKDFVISKSDAILEGSANNNLSDPSIKWYINPTGRYVIHSSIGDAGVTGRKLVCNTYGGYAPIGGGSMACKDPTKVDRSANYMARYIAKNIVAAGIMDKCLIQLSYAIGVVKPLSVFINDYGTSKIDCFEFANSIRDKIDLSPRGIIKRLDLLAPIYAKTNYYGHFGGKIEERSWEKLDLMDDLKKLI